MDEIWDLEGESLRELQFVVQDFYANGLDNLAKYTASCFYLNTGPLRRIHPRQNLPEHLMLI